MRGGNRVAAGAVPLTRRDLHTVVHGQPIERPPAQLRQDPARETHCAQSPSRQRTTRGPRDLRADESPVERRVVRHEHVSLERPQHVVADAAKRCLLAYHVPRDVGESRNEWWNGALRIHERLVHLLHAAIAHEDDGNLGDAIVPAGLTARRLDVHHGERKR